MLSYPSIVEPSPGQLVISTGLSVVYNQQGKRIMTDIFVFRLTESAILSHTEKDK